MQQRTVFWFLLLLSYNAYATHNRAGEITFRHISGYKYEFTISTYTYRLSPANSSRNVLSVDWGDGSSTEEIQRVNIEYLENDYQFNTYQGTHTYAGPGIYEVLMEDPNRNQGVKNIPNSVYTVFSIKTKIVIGTDNSENSTPELLNPPIDNAARGHIFIHNPGAYDPDGDSISYKLTVCTGDDGYEIEGYVLPLASDTLFLNPLSGNLIWNTPVDTGVYNIAMFVDEWRKGKRISRIARDMQIDVYETDNNAPIDSGLKDFCVLAGESISLHVQATDPDNDAVILTMFGGVFSVDNPAVFDVDSSVNNTTYGTFTWNTDCSHARKFPYTVLLKSEDITSDDINLVDISEFYITVMHKAPEGLELYPGVDTIKLSWEKSSCGDPSGYYIYRRIGRANYIPDSCERGVPAYTEYEKIGTTYDKNKTVFTDDDDGLGLVPGYDYCYMVTAWYSDGAESQASDEVCTTLVAGVPAMLKVSVEEHHKTAGEIDIAWHKPLGIDTIYDGDFQYEIRRKKPGDSDFNVISTFVSEDLNDTTYTDAGINTYDYPYYYNVRLYYGSTGNWEEIPGSETASSTYLDIFPEDNKLTVTTLKRTPWLNREYTTFRSRDSVGFYDSIGYDSVNIFIDDNLTNGKKYFYKTYTKSVRPIDGYEYETINKSHIGRGIPLDTVPPCSPVLQVSSYCDESYNYLEWSLPDEGCEDAEIVSYYVYYKETIQDDQFAAIDTIENINQFNYQHYPTGRLAGCYAVTAVDSVGNESKKLSVCIDTCEYYKLPNVFTPNNDEIGNLFIADNLGGFIQKVDMCIYNRYGQEVFTTHDPYIRWNGRWPKNGEQGTGELVTTGVYYYVCTVYEPRITSVDPIPVILYNFIHVYSGEDN